MRYMLLILLSIQLFAVDATLKITKDVEQRAKISLVDSSVGLSPSLSEKFFSILVSDLKISGHFVPDTEHYRESSQSNFIAPNLKSKEYVLKYNISQQSGLTIDIKLFRASDATLLTHKDYSVSSSAKYPFLAHKMVTYLNDTLKYPDISWINRYIVISRYTTAKRSEIVLADYTMSFQKTVIRGGLNLFPKWADKDQRSFYYTSFAGAIPTLYRLNIYNGSKTRITSSQGMLVCSDVNYDTNKILVTMAPNGQPDIYEMSASGGGASRVTSFAGIDVNGKYTTSGSLAFVSNRMGYPNIFTKTISGSAVTQLVFRGKNNNAVDAYDNRIVYSSRESHNDYGQNTFNLYLTHTNDSSTRPLTSRGVNQFPRFSIDGSTILYIKQYQNRSSVGYINLISNQNLLFPLGGKVQSIDW